jgi:putrescine transport system substrate-binding protein
MIVHRLGALGLVMLAGALVGACARAPSPEAPPVMKAEIAVPGEDNVVNVLNWTDYIAPDTIERFERETGIRVNYDVFDSNEVLETKLLTGHTGYDVVVPTDYFLERQAQHGILLPLDRAKLPHYQNLDPVVMTHLEGVDPGNRYGIPYAGVMTGIGYNVAAVKKVLGDVPIDSWRVIFDPKNAERLKACGFTMLDAEAEVFFSAKIWIGVDPASERLEDLRAVETLLKGVRPAVRYFNSSQYINDLANGEICIALSWSGDVLQARDRAAESHNGVEIRFVAPKEGLLQSYDMLAIPADAQHPNNAHKFIDFLLRADIAANFTRARKFPSGNLAAIPLLEPELRADEIIFPPAAVRDRLLWHRAESLTYTRYANRAWTRVRTGH